MKPYVCPERDCKLRPLVGEEFCSVPREPEECADAALEADERTEGEEDSE